MIIDSHAHYSVFQFNNQFPFLDTADGSFIRSHGTRKELFARMSELNIRLCIEPSVRFENLEPQLALARENPSFILSAVGVHPKYCLYAPWEERETLLRAARENPTVAIGETGFDFSIPLTDEERETQRKWFFYQISLARELRLPLILHTRDADGAVLDVLEKERFPFGGVVHCFGGDLQTANAYRRLGFALGIGGKLLQNTSEAEALRDAVRGVPLSDLLIETDAPYVHPNLDGTALTQTQKNKVRNTSLILPAVIEEIARLQETSAACVENAVFENTKRVFHL
ncbi:MAG: TatD family hydrolase [Clostridia bacterium]|nr:TatD family hydrolase [Clostridia bacterium]